MVDRGEVKFRVQSEVHCQSCSLSVRCGTIVCMNICMQHKVMHMLLDYVSPFNTHILNEHCVPHMNMYGF